MVRSGGVARLHLGEGETLGEGRAAAGDRALDLLGEGLGLVDSADGRVEVGQCLDEPETPIGGGAAIDGKTRFYVPHVDNKVIESGEVYARAYGGTAREDAYPSIQLEFASAVASGTITHEVVNHSAVKLTFDWGATGMRGEIKPGETLRATRNAPTGAVERKSNAEYQISVEGLGLITINSPISILAPAPRVPTPGTLAIAGFAGLLAARRRR